MSSPVIPNPWNQLLAQKHNLVRRAIRYALAPLCDPATGEQAPTGAQIRLQLKHIQINAAAAGDNIVIPALAGVKQIYELVMWNVTAQNCQWQQGATGSNPITLLNLPSFHRSPGSCWVSMAVSINLTGKSITARLWY